MKPIHLLALSCLALVCPARADDATLTIGKQSVHAEIVATPGARARGLMQRGRLCADCGMLFVFPSESRYGFWMKDTVLPLSIAFVARNGRIINIEEMQPNTLEVHYPQENALYALEMSGGWFAAHGVRPGDKVGGIPQVHAE